MAGMLFPSLSGAELRPLGYRSRSLSQNLAANNEDLGRPAQRRVSMRNCAHPLQAVSGLDRGS